MSKGRRRLQSARLRFRRGIRWSDKRVRAVRRKLPAKANHWGMWSSPHANLPRWHPHQGRSPAGSRQTDSPRPATVDDGSQNLVGAITTCMGNVGAATIRQFPGDGDHRRTERQDRRGKIVPDCPKVRDGNPLIVFLSLGNQNSTEPVYLHQNPKLAAYLALTYLMPMLGQERIHSTARRTVSRAVLLTRCPASTTSPRWISVSVCGRHNFRWTLARWTLFPRRL